MKRYFVKVTFHKIDNRVLYFGTHDDRVYELTPENIKRSGYKTKDGALNNWHYMEYKRHEGTTVEIVECNE